MFVFAHISSQRPSGPISMMAGEVSFGTACEICDCIFSFVSLLSVAACMSFELLVVECDSCVGWTEPAGL